MMMKTRSLALLAALTLMSAAANAQTTTLHVTKDYYLAHADKALIAGDMAKAAGLYRRALSKSLTEGERVAAQNSLCAAEYSLGRYDAAKTACTRAIRADGSYWKAYVNRANVLKAEGQADAALADYCAAHALAPAHVKGPFVDQCPA